MFIFTAAFSIGLIALVSGVYLYSWATLHPSGTGMTVAKIFGILVIIFTVVSSAVTVYFGVKYWHSGYFQNPAQMQAEINSAYKYFKNHALVKEAT